MRLILIVLCLSVYLTSNGQDTVFKSDGNQIAAKVIEVSKTEIRYKLQSDTAGPVYVLPKEDVYMVEYSSGRKEVFASENHAKSKAEKTKIKKEMTELEILYRRRKGGGIAETIIGSLGVVVTTSLFADGMITMRSSTGDIKDRAKVQAITSGSFFIIGVIALGAGIDNLVKASVIKSRIDKGEVSLSPTILPNQSFQGGIVTSSPTMGIGLTYRF